MDIVAVNNNQFTHYPKRIPKGTVNAELVQLRLDKEWEGLTVFWHWRNMGTKAEIREELADHAAPHKIPWEVLTDLGDLEMGLVGMDGETTVKPTIWLTYGYVVDGVDPDIGDDPQPPTPNYLEQMVEQATQANQAAQAAQEAAEDAAESAASAGPYAEESKKSAEVAKASREAAATSAQQASQAAKDAQAAAGSIGNAVEQAQSAATAADVAKRAAETAQTAAAQSAGTAQGAATTASQAAQTAQGAATQAGQYLASVEADAQAAASAATAAGKSQEAAQGAAQAAANARDQATTAATTAQDNATAADAAKTAAEQAATTAGNAQAGAAQSAQAAAGSASAAQASKEAAEAAASILPAPTPEDAGKGLRVNTDGTGYEFWNAGGGELLLAEYTHQGNQEIHFTSFDWETGIGECMEPHGLSAATEVMLVPNTWWTSNMGANVPAIPIEWLLYKGRIHVVPVSESQAKLTGSDKITPIPVDTYDVSNKNINFSRFHVEIPVGFSISDFPIEPLAIRITAHGYIIPFRYRYLTLPIRLSNGKTNSGPYVPMLDIPGIGTISKAYHGIPFWYNISAEAFPGLMPGLVMTGVNLYRGQRSGYSTYVGDKTAEEIVDGYNAARDATSFCGLNVLPGYACYSNRTMFHIYAKGVRQK